MCYDRIREVLADKSSAELVNFFTSIGLPQVGRTAETEDVRRKQVLDYFLDHAVPAKQKQAMEKICAALGIPTDEEIRTDLATQQLAELKKTSWQRFCEKWIAEIVVGVIVTILGGIALVFLLA